MSEFVGRSRAPSDPLARAIQPPPNETTDQRAERLRAEERARQRNDAIDKQLKAEKHSKSSRKEVHLLLLGVFFFYVSIFCVAHPKGTGQSESGKSTLAR